MTRARDVANLIGSGNYSSTTFTATAGQTAFTISHTQGFVQVFMNGLLLDETVDYTSNGTAITLTSGAAVGDEIEVVAYNTFSVGDAQTQAQADTRYLKTSSGGTVTGNTTVTGDFFVTNSANAHLSISDVIGEVGSGNLAFQSQNTAGSALKPMGFRAEDIRFATGSAERVRITDNGLTFNGDTAATNALDDYEEGNWTPTIHQGGFGINVSMARYTKIGRQVTVLTDLSLTGSGNSSDLIIGGLPFSNSTLGYASGAGYTAVWPGGNHFTPTVGASGTLVRFMTGAGAYYDANQFNAGYLNFTITYFI